MHARLELEDFFEQTGVDLRDPDTEEEEYDTIGGLVFSITNRSWKRRTDSRQNE